MTIAVDMGRKATKTNKQTNQTAPIGAVCSGSTLFACILNLSVMLGNYLQQTTCSYRSSLIWVHNVCLYT